MLNSKSGTVILIAALAICGCRQQTQKTDASAIAKSSEIVRALIPDQVADTSKINDFKRSEAISALTEEQKKAEGLRAVGIAYLLCVLGHDYDENRKKVVTAILDCRGNNQIPCDSVARYGMAMTRSGDRTLLKPLFAIGIDSDGALAELLGGFFSDYLWRTPRSFLEVLSELPQEEQTEICMLAGATDARRTSDVVLKDIHAELRKLVRQDKETYESVATTCLSGVDSVTKEVRMNNQAGISRK